MSIYVIGDPHLALSCPKPMDIFAGWDGYQQRLEENWRATVSPEDTVVVAGDVSWAMKLEDTVRDFDFLHSLPGRKLLLKGNHDYWWSTRAKLDRFFAQRGWDSLEILHNNAIEAEGVALCGSRGWIFENGEPADALVVAREAGRIRRSLEAVREGLEPVLFLHYPPIYGQQVIAEFFDLMKEFGVRRCFYGHLHGPAISNAFQGEFFGVDLRLVSADYLKFTPFRVL